MKVICIHTHTHRYDGCALLLRRCKLQITRPVQNVRGLLREVSAQRDYHFVRWRRRRACARVKRFSVTGRGTRRWCDYGRVHRDGGTVEGRGRANDGDVRARRKINKTVALNKQTAAAVAHKAVKPLAYNIIRPPQLFPNNRRPRAARGKPPGPSVFF